MWFERELRWHRKYNWNSEKSVTIFKTYDEERTKKENIKISDISRQNIKLKKWMTTKNRMFWICYIANSLLNYLLMADSD